MELGKQAVGVVMAAMAAKASMVALEPALRPRAGAFLDLVIREPMAELAVRGAPGAKAESVVGAELPFRSVSVQATRSTKLKSNPNRVYLVMVVNLDARGIQAPEDLAAVPMT
jgi:hypothetical protein